MLYIVSLADIAIASLKLILNLLVVTGVYLQMKNILSITLLNEVVAKSNNKNS